MAYHIPIMLQEIMEDLRITSGKTYLDCTLGGGGHSEEILKRSSPDGRLLAIDKDGEAISYNRARLTEYADRITYIRGDFKNAAEYLRELGLSEIDGALIDLGISSHQIDSADRGFSYMQDARLDMRMNTEQTLSAHTIVNTYTAEELARIFYLYGEEDFSRPIARNIVAAREETPIETTLQLVEIIRKSIPKAVAAKGGHPAKKVFQAIRIEVNGELEGLDTVLKSIAGMLRPEARLAVLTFHSLEDRIVKQVFKEMSTGCICDKSLPICVCRHTATVRTVGKQPRIPSPSEQKNNSRSAPAKLRIIEKLNKV